MPIRAFVPDDLAPLTELTIETFRPFYEDSFRPLVGEVVFAGLHDDWRGDYRKQIAELHAPERHAYVAVADAEDGIAGYVAWSVDPSRRTGSVTHLAVAARHRHHRVGTTLCEHAFAQMRTLGARSVEIGTGGDSFHAPARALYESLGCTPFPVTYYYREL
ncbi:GNAT family N-acetyltransferase [Streptomyces sp. NPDC052023]|uniref:GNAT family N-acetyltransferase n=1 Tax=Streptomyces sp. NPDC052023 TaxID=3365681 RepID=UPI0037D70FEB